MQCVSSRKKRSQCYKIKQYLLEVFSPKILHEWINGSIEVGRFKAKVYSRSKNSAVVLKVICRIISDVLPHWGDVTLFVSTRCITDFGCVCFCSFLFHNRDMRVPSLVRQWAATRLSRCTWLTTFAISRVWTRGCCSWPKTTSNASHEEVLSCLIIRELHTYNKCIQFTVKKSKNMVAAFFKFMINYNFLLTLNDILAYWTINICISPLLYTDRNTSKKAGADEKVKWAFSTSRKTY